jgi:hypothetical protein
MEQWQVFIFYTGSPSNNGPTPLRADDATIKSQGKCAAAILRQKYVIDITPNCLVIP